MKKIVFVQKQQSSTYDPVSTFFANSQNKKGSSLAKPSVPTQSSKNVPQNNRAAGSIERPPTTKQIADKQKRVPQFEQKQKPITGKIGRKGDHLPPKKPQSGQIATKKQQSVYGIGGVNSKKNIKNITKQSNEGIEQKQQYQPSPYNDYQQDQLVLPNVNQRRSPVKNNQYGQLNYDQGSSKQINSQQSSQQLGALRKRIKQLENCEQEYIRKIQQFEEKEQKYVKMQQKYTKLQKQHKLCGSQKQAGKKLKQKEEQLKKILSKDEIPYNKKRQAMLMNQINSLKKINRELTTRIKNYKGTDLVELSLNKNKTEVLFKQYDHTNMLNQVDEENQQNNAVDTAKIQSLAFQVVQKIQSYIQAKNNSKEMAWNDDKKLLADLTNYCKEISLQCLSYDWKMPASNQESCNLYNQIQRYRRSLEPLISKYDINFVITQENIELINTKNQQISESIEFKESLPRAWNEEPKRFKKVAQASAYYLNKCKSQASLFQKNSNLNSIILAHCLSQIGFFQSWINKMTAELRQSLTNLGVRLKEVEELCSLGEAGKQSLVLYIKSNIQDLLIKVPNLQLQVKQIGTIFKKVKAPVNKLGK